MLSGIRNVVDSIDGKVLYFALATFILVLCLLPWVVILLPCGFLVGYFLVEVVEAFFERRNDLSLKTQVSDPLQSFLKADEKNAELKKLSSSESSGKGAECDLKIDKRLDEALTKFFDLVFDYYISDSWAPYSTRQQLRVDLRKLLHRFGTELKEKLIEKDAVMFVKEKVLPVVLYHVSVACKSQTPVLLSSEAREIHKLKVRCMCRHILSRYMSKADQECTIWMELCTSVLADGVLWNLFNLGNEKLPCLIIRSLSGFLSEEKPVALEHKLKTLDRSISQATEKYDEAGSHQNFDETVEQRIEVPFLLDFVTSRNQDVDCPYGENGVGSRWRVSLNVVKTENELLYPLIQYLKSTGGSRAVSYLQGCLEESNQSEYCQKIFEAEYLPGFSRSDQLFDALGLDKLDVAEDVLTESLSPKRLSGHVRSASYGGPAIKLRQTLESNTVEGYPLHPTPVYGTPKPFEPNVTIKIFPDAIDTDFFRRRPHMELLIGKFMRSTIVDRRKHWFENDVTSPNLKRVGSSVSKRNTLKRIEYVKYQQLNKLYSAYHITKCWSNVDCWYWNYVDSWVQLLESWLQPHFESLIEKVIEENLTLDAAIDLIYIICDAFADTSHVEEPGNWRQENADHSTCSYTQHLLKSLLVRFVNQENIIRDIVYHKDIILKIFLDTLDMLIETICKDSS